MDSLAADAIGPGVRVNSILPSIIYTPANRVAMPQSDFRDVAQACLIFGTSPLFSPSGVLLASDHGQGRILTQFMRSN
jgi:hypothetical protein